MRAKIYKSAEFQPIYILIACENDMRYVVKTQKFNLTDSQKLVAKKLGISEAFLRLLLGRGFKEDEIAPYLHPSVDNMSPPYDINGMDRAVERLRRAIDNKEKILIYGDYDCDGICAVSTLMLCLKDIADVTYFIPDRNRDGYGVSVDALKRLIASRRPDLVITVDCGITAVKEIEFLKDNGIDVIVTDHHEPQEQIPDCIVLDPKVERKGFCDYCGAGVAFKLVEAFAGREEACKYLDIVAIATIADVVPLKGDNRIIAYFGIRQMKSAPRKGIKMLLGEDEVSSHNIMFRLAPRMNAAGRLNSAMKVVGLFLETDYFLLKSLAEELIRDNLKRQELCDEVVQEANDMLRGADFAATGLIALYSEKWEAGVLGIAAAKLVEEFKRPAVLFAKNGNALKGSARSVPCVNIFELFSNLNRYFTSFGGHAQAAGVSLNIDNFEEFKEAADKLILAEHSLSDFIPDTYCEMELPLDFDFLSFAKELALMEPVGYGNAKPVFLVKADGLKFEQIGFSKHVKCVTDDVDLLGFSDYADCLMPKTGKIDMEVALDINCFRNKLTAQGLLRSVGFETVSLSEDEARILNLHHLNYDGGAYVTNVPLNAVEQNIENSPFGTLIVCFSAEDYKKICGESGLISKLPVSVGNVSELNPCNRVVICPCEKFDFAFYHDVVIAGAPLTEGYTAHIVNSAERVVCLGDCTPNTLKVSDTELRSIYKSLAYIAAGKNRANNMHSLYLQVCERYSASESTFMLAMKIFGQLGLVQIGDRGVLNVSRKSVTLENSLAYRLSLHG